MLKYGNNGLSNLKNNFNLDLIKEVQHGLDNRKQEAIMKKFMLIVASLLLCISVYGKEIIVNYLQMRNGLSYEVNQEQLFTGKFIGAKHSNGQIKTEVSYKNGKKKKGTAWHESGQKRTETVFKNGTLNGSFTTWLENGQKESEGNIKNGKRERVVTYWHESGMKKSETNYKNGQQEGLANVWFENGMKQYESNYRNGIQQGLLTEWYKNGEVKNKVNYKNGIRQ